MYDRSVEVVDVRLLVETVVVEDEANVTAITTAVEPTPTQRHLKVNVTAADSPAITQTPAISSSSSDKPYPIFIWIPKRLLRRGTTSTDVTLISKIIVMSVHFRTQASYPSMEPMQTTLLTS